MTTGDIMITLARLDYIPMIKSAKLTDGSVRFFLKLSVHKPRAKKMFNYESKFDCEGNSLAEVLEKGFNYAKINRAL